MPYGGCKTLATLRERAFLANPFAPLSDDLLRRILTLDIDGLRGHRAAVIACRQFAAIAERLDAIAHTATIATWPARAESCEGQQLAALARTEEVAVGRWVMPFRDDGAWRGARSRWQWPHGLGVFRQGPMCSAAYFSNSEEEGPGECHYRDGSRFARALLRGCRHGPGVSEDTGGPEGGLWRHEGG